MILTKRVSDLQDALGLMSTDGNRVSSKAWWHGRVARLAVRSNVQRVHQVSKIVMDCFLIRMDPTVGSQSLMMGILYNHGQ